MATIIKCDRCGKEVIDYINLNATGTSVNPFHVLDRKLTKYYDICDDCFSAFEDFLKKGEQKCE